jgi:hypothetical protein
MILGYSKNKEKVWLFSPFFTKWVEYNIDEKKFYLFDDKEKNRPLVDETIIIMDSYNKNGQVINLSEYE